ncbi:hypothetical protein AX774_g4403 [Zancudomyces culisetae]|uniref:Uncharacterized protein n=1 Tax=Zancudomyces culisetae TaxID=1213189 RepID=A0A1R1PMG8_ZANCU|nr:hypothetical protein AX774_g4403 [Zancudomyces culisetae]|eukprot:OMH82133.1 hypothetical protein AX774_g4403 [Zancudomyces culisetae]
MEVNGGQDKKSEDENKVLDGIKSVDKAENTQQEEEQKGDKEGETISTENSEKIKNEQVETQAQAGQGKGKEREDAQNVLGLKQESEQVQVQEQESEQVQEQEQRVIDKAKSARFGKGQGYKRKDNIVSVVKRGAFRHQAYNPKWIVPTVCQRGAFKDEQLQVATRQNDMHNELLHSHFWAVKTF